MRPSRKAQGSKVRGLGSDAPLPHPSPRTSLVLMVPNAHWVYIHHVCNTYGVFTEAASASERSYVSMHF